VRFLIAVGLDAETAEADAEGLEHHAGEKALAAFARFLDAQNGKRR
jgi:DtxR family manganese transport transcriptional regulator